LWKIAVEVRSLGVILGDGGNVLARPGLAGIDLGVRYPLSMVAPRFDRDCEPKRSPRRFDAIPVAPAMLVELNIIVIDENVTTSHLVEKAEPGQVSWLEDDQINA